MIWFFIVQFTVGKEERREIPKIEVKKEGKIRYPFSAVPTIYDTLRVRSIITEKTLLVPPKDYTFSAGDVVIVRISGDVPYEYETIVDYDGYIPIYFPTGKTGRSIKISDIRYDSLKSYLNRKFSKYLRGYRIHVFLKSPAVFPVVIEGEVSNITSIYVDGLMRLHDVLKYVPLKPNASRDKFLIIYEDTSFYIDLKNMYSSGDIYESPLLKPNMRIEVLRDSSFCVVFVKGAEVVNCDEGESVLSVFRKATFLDLSYKPKGFVIKRNGFKKVDGDYTVKVGDTILPIVHSDSVYVSGYVNYPQPLPFVPMAPAAYYVSQAGGFKDNAVIGRYTLITREGKRFKIDDSYIPMPGDIIYVDRTLFTVKDLIFYATSFVGVLATLVNTYLLISRR